MGYSRLLILVLVLNVAHYLEILGQSEDMITETTKDITAVLGEDVYLSCIYLGETMIERAGWRRQINTNKKSRRLTGISGGKPFSSADFSEPESVNNLTVKMNVSRVELEGKYVCEFESEEGDSVSNSTYVTIIAQPDIQILVNAEIIDSTHYQSVSCSAIGGRPPAQINWLVNGLPASDYPFTFNVTNTVHSNGTSTLSSILRFPTHLQDEDSVTCEVQHQSLPNPKYATARVETYARPNVTIKAEMLLRGGNEFWVVSCISSGGRPNTEISLALNTDKELQTENDTNSEIQKVSVYLPATGYEGHNVTCMFDHPKFTQRESHVITLPSYYLSEVQLLVSQPGINKNDFQGSESLNLQEGQRDAVIGLQITGNVPRFNVTCKKDDGLLPDDVELVGSSITVQGPVECHHAGLYECIASYHHLKAMLRFNITVIPHVIQPVPPTIHVDLRAEDRRRLIECSAADAVPAANMSWLLPEGVSVLSWFNFTSHNGSHSVRGVLLLPACLPWEITTECVINHPAFERPENRSITLPACARPNITITSSTEWKDGEKFTNVACLADSVASAAAITWHVGNGDDIISRHMETEDQANGLVSVRSSVHFLSSLFAGQNLTCMVQHPSLEVPEKRTIHIPVHKAPQLSVSVMRQHNSRFWLAVCEFTGEDVRANLDWILTENAKGQTTLQSEYDGRAMIVRLTYQFTLDLHEGQDLTCVYKFKHGTTEKRSVHIPKYYISAVRVLNHTTPLHVSHSGESPIHRVTLDENHRKQKILLQVEGNVPQYELSCKRSDGSFAHMEGLAMVFQSEVTEQDKGLYTCCASFDHHMATVRIEVEVLTLVFMISISSASAIMLILIVALWVCCQLNSRTPYKKKESLSALTTLMQEPGSPEVKKQEMTENANNDYAQLISYSIVIDVKSTV